MSDDEEHDQIPDDHAADVEADAGTMPDHEDSHPATGETPRRH